MFKVFHFLTNAPHFFWHPSSFPYISPLSSVFFLLEMAELRANGFGVPNLFPIDANGFAHVYSFHLSIKLCLHDGSIWVERKIVDPLTSMLSLTVHENSMFADNGPSVWKIAAREYRIYGLPEFGPQKSRDPHPFLFVRFQFQHPSHRSCQD